MLCTFRELGSRHELEIAKWLSRMMSCLSTDRRLYKYPKPTRIRKICAEYSDQFSHRISRNDRRNCCTESRFGIAQNSLGFDRLTLQVVRPAMRICQHVAVGTHRSIRVFYCSLFGTLVSPKSGKWLTECPYCLLDLANICDCQYPWLIFWLELRCRTSVDLKN